MKKIVLIFPGIGYHCDKPLLYYSKKIALSCDYEIREVNYGGFPEKVRGDVAKMKQCFNMALEQSEEILADIDFSSYGDILIIGKSVGTAVAGAYANRHALDARFILYTPVEQTFLNKFNNAIAFHGTNDPWVETSVIKDLCEKNNIPVYITENANHSLETGNMIKDIENILEVMKITEEYINVNFS